MSISNNITFNWQVIEFWHEFPARIDRRIVNNQIFFPLHINISIWHWGKKNIRPLLPWYPARWINSLFSWRINNMHNITMARNGVRAIFNAYSLVHLDVDAILCGYWIYLMRFIDLFRKRWTRDEWFANCLIDKISIEMPWRKSTLKRTNLWWTSLFNIIMLQLLAHFNLSIV